MRKPWHILLAGVLAAAIGACTGDEPPDEVRPTPTPLRPQIGAWTPLADLPQARTELSATVLDGMVYAAGGFVAGPGDEAFFRYDPASDTWSELAPLPEARHHAPMAASGGSVYVVGGYDTLGASSVSPFGFATADLFVYDAAGDAWQEGPALPEPVGAHAVAVTETGMIHVFGGLSDQPLPGRNEHRVFDPAAGTWASLPPMPTGREHVGAAYLDGVVYVAAGRGGGEGVAFEAYDVDSQEWTVLPDVPTSRSGVAVVAFQEQIYVLGGETLVQTFDHAERFDPQSGSWQEVTPMLSARHGFGGVALDDGIMVIGGGPGVGLTYSAGTEIWRP